jgi:hypothetical protein
MKQLIWGRVAQIILAFVGTYNLYQALLALWMTANPFADPSLWRTRFYTHCGVTAAVATVVIPLTIWLGRQSRKLKTAAKNRPSRPTR